MTIDIRTLTPDDHEAVHDLVSQAFSARPRPYDPSRPTMPDDGRLGAFVDGRLVGHCGIWAMGQWFGGRQVPMGGIGAVAVAPEMRGSGVGSALLARALNTMRARGQALSVLYPATVGPYRRAGWELAGSYVRREVAARSLAGLPAARDTGLREATDDDLPAMVACYDRVAPAHNGMIARPAPLAHRVLGAGGGGDGRTFRYVAHRDGEVVGYVVYDHAEADDVGGFFRLRVTELVGVDRDAELALLHLVASHRSVVEVVTLPSRPADPLLLALAEDDLRAPPRPWHWMARLVDAPAAVAARGYLAGLDVQVPLTIVDAAVDANAGRYVLAVEDGHGALTPGGPGRVTVTIGDLSALFTGWANPADLRRLGRLDGATDADVAALTAAFAGPPPWMGTFF